MRDIVNILVKTTLLLFLSECIICGGEEKTREEFYSYAEKIAYLMDECYQDDPDVPWITLEEFKKRRTQGEWIILDVRDVHEREVSMIPGARDIDQFYALEDEHWEKNILVYCTIGCRSAQFTRKLIKEGYEAYNLSGGVLAWALEGRSFRTPDGNTTHKVHVYGPKWNVLPPGYQSVLDER